MNRVVGKTTDIFDDNGNYVGSKSESTYGNEGGGKPTCEDMNYQDKNQVVKEFSKVMAESMHVGDAPDDLAGFMFVGVRNDGEHVTMSHNIDGETSKIVAMMAGRVANHTTAETLCMTEKYDELTKFIESLYDAFMLGCSMEIPEKDVPYYIQYARNLKDGK